MTSDAGVRTKLPDEAEQASVSRAVVACARSYIGTQYRHQGWQSDSLDCAGLIRRVGTDLGLLPDPLPEWVEYDGYSRQPDGFGLLEACRKYLLPASYRDAMPGDIALLRFDSAPQHVAIIGDYKHSGLTLIHAVRSVNKVIEHRLDALWKSRIIERFIL